jgi:hypothetical protein
MRRSGLPRQPGRNTAEPGGPAPSRGREAQPHPGPVEQGRLVRFRRQASCRTLPAREMRRDIESELERFDPQKLGRANPNRLGRRGPGRVTGRSARVHGRVPGDRRQLFRLLVPVGRPHPRASDAVPRALLHRSDAALRFLNGRRLAVSFARPRFLQERLTERLPALMVLHDTRQHPCRVGATLIVGFWSALLASL